MGFFLTLIIVVGAWAVQEWLKPTPNPSARNASPSTEGDFDFPIVGEGNPIPIIFGTRWCNAPNVIWWGDVGNEPIIEVEEYKYKKFFSTKTKTVENIVGYKYFCGMHMVMCNGPVDGIRKIKSGDKIIYTGNDGVSGAWISQADCFGGNQREGGIEGDVSFLLGNPSQSVNSYLNSKLSNPPAFRYLCSAVCEHVYVGTTAYVKPWRFQVKRTDVLLDSSTQWYSSKAVINTYDLNPVHIIRECLIDKNFGLGINSADIDDTNFQEVADTLYTEGLGLSFIWAGTTTVQAFINDVLQHIDGIIIVNQLTGKYEIRLAREDYTVGDLDVYDQDDIKSVDSFIRPGILRQTNQVVVRYSDRNQEDKSGVVTVSNMAMINREGATFEESYDFYGVTSRSLANKLAARELRQASTPLAKLSITATRTMAHLKPNDVFKLTWPLLDIDQLIVRVTSITESDPTNGYVKLDLVEDIFSVEDAIYADPVDTEWTDPHNDPADVTTYKFIEVPYFLLNNGFLDDDELTQLSNDDGIAIVLAARPTSDASTYQLLTRKTASDSWTSIGVFPFTPNATLENLLPLAGSSATIAVDNADALTSVEDNTYAIIEDEIVLVTDVDYENEQITIERGVMDTVPVQHSAGTRIWFFGRHYGYFPEVYDEADTPRVKMLTMTGNGILAEGSATERTMSDLDSRMIRPLVPCNLEIDGVDLGSTFSDDLDLDWVNKSRTEVDAIKLWTDTTQETLETNQSHEIKIYDETGSVLLRTISSITGTSYSYTQAFEDADDTLARNAGDPQYDGGNTGDGDVTGITPAATAPEETWTLTCKAGATAFTVVGSVSGSQSDATIGSAYNNSIIAFTINQGGTNWAEGDIITIEVSIDYNDTLRVVMKSSRDGYDSMQEYDITVTRT